MLRSQGVASSGTGSCSILLTLSRALWGHGDSAVWDVILVDELNAHRNLTDLSLAEPGRRLHTCCISLAGLELGRLLRGSMWPAFGPRWTQGPNASPHQLRPSARSARVSVTQGRLLPLSSRLAGTLLPLPLPPELPVPRDLGSGVDERAAGASRCGRALARDGTLSGSRTLEILIEQCGMTSPCWLLVVGKGWLVG